ncbi:MAG: hypothetical protein P1U32_06060 [Legionellaceae bacterium]|nr:hypothetical protein [Legionellaceae bacterium]
MKSLSLKRLFNWKFLALLAVIGLVACSDGETSVEGIIIAIILIIAIFSAIGAEEDAVLSTLKAADIQPPPRTNAAVFSVNWTQKADAQNAGSNYQLSLPFSDYTRTDNGVKPNNHFNFTQSFHFGMPLLAEKDANGNLPETFDEAKQFNSPFSLSFTPVASNKQQLAQDTEWLALESNIPQNTLGASRADNIVRLYQPITLKKDNKIVATVNTMVIEKNQVQQGSHVNIALDGVYSPIKTQEKNVSATPGSFSFVLNHLDANLVHQLEKEVQTIKNLPSDKQMLMQLKMLSQLKALCQKGSTLTVTYDVNTVSGPVKQHYTVDLSDLVKAPAKLSGAMPFALESIFEGQQG